QPARDDRPPARRAGLGERAGAAAIDIAAGRRPAPARIGRQRRGELAEGRPRAHLRNRAAGAEHRRALDQPAPRAVGRAPEPARRVPGRAPPQVRNAGDPEAVTLEEKEIHVSNRSATHSTFVIERDYEAAAARVFAAWADKSAKGRWFGPSEGEHR